MPRLNLAFAASLVVALLVAPAAVAKPDKPPKPDKPAKAEQPASHGKPDKPDEPASAGTPAAAVGCAERSFSKVFAAFHDRALYTLAPDGAFEGGAAGWALAGGAAVAAGSSSIQLAGPGTSSLSLPAGASATTPAICVEHGFPSFRFALRGSGVVRVQVLYDGGRSKKTGRIRARHAWRITRKLSLAQGRFHVASGGSANVQLRFTASGGTVALDDVYVDPRLRR